MDIITLALSKIFTKRHVAQKIAELPVPFKPSGTISFSELPEIPTQQDLGKIWNISNAFTTDSRFIEGAGIPISAGNNVAVIEDNSTYYFDIFSQVDLSNYYNKTETNQLLGGKVDKEDGKGLSSNDYTGNEKNKLRDIEAGAQKNAPNTVIDEHYTHTDNNYTTEEKNKLRDIEEEDQKNAPNTVVDANYVHTDNNYNNEAKEKVAQVDDKVNYILNGKHVAKDSTMQDINNALILIAQAKGATKVTTFKEMQRNVRAGLGPILYPVGFRFNVVHTVYGTLTWIVTGHNQIQSATGKQYTMTCVVKDCIANVQFDGVEAIYANATTAALAAGDYSFTLNGVDYYFTTTMAIPVGGQICKSAGDAYVPTQLKSYSGPLSTTELETITPSTTPISGAISLGTSGSGNINHHHRTWYASNNYGESAIRQFLNSILPAGQVWEPTTKFDRPPSWAATLAGFMNGLPAEFLDVVDFAEVKCSTNNFYESPDSKTPKNTKYTLRDKFFLPSRFEVYGSSDVVDDSVLMEYYVGATNADRIKLLSGSARYWWLRTPLSGYACSVRLVRTDGSLYDSSAFNSLGCVPACIIA